MREGRSTLRWSQSCHGLLNLLSVLSDVAGTIFLTGRSALPLESTSWPAYYLFGCTVRSNFPFQIELPSSEGEPALTLSFHPGIPSGLPKGMEPVYESELVNKDGVPLAILHKLPDGYLLRMAEIADFAIQENSLQCFPCTEDIRMVEAFLFQAAMSFWLETTGRPVLHASCIAAADLAVAFLAFSGRGKSTLAAAFLQDGYRLISDDSLPVEISEEKILAWPCHPRIKMMPEQAKLFLGEVDHLPPVNGFSTKIGVPVRETWSGSFGTTPKKLVCCYLPEHRPEQPDVVIERVRGAAAVIELVRHSLVPRLTAGAGMQRERFHLLHQMATRLEVCRLIYPSGIDSLRAVREAVVLHVESLS